MSLFARRAELPAATGYSVVDEHLVIRGEVDTQGTIRIDGRVEGRVHRADTMIIGATGVVVGDIEAREVVVAGSVKGNIVADARVEVQAAATVRGDIRSKAIMLHEGGTLNGHLIVEHAESATDGPHLELSGDRPLALPR